MHAHSMSKLGRFAALRHAVLKLHGWSTPSQIPEQFTGGVGAADHVCMKSTAAASLKCPACPASEQPADWFLCCIMLFVSIGSSICQQAATAAAAAAILPMQPSCSVERPASSVA